MTQEPLLGRDMFGDPVMQGGGALAKQFILPPFSVLDARQGAWQERKRAWLALGIQSELGRGAAAVAYNIDRSGPFAQGVDSYGQNLRNLSRAPDSVIPTGTGPMNPYLARSRQTEEGVGTSVFDPVLCELVYEWFSEPGAQIIDPFAGGSVRGIVAGRMGRHYWGCDLSERQIAANQKQAEKIFASGLGLRPAWIAGDAIDRLQDAPMADVIFTCPPYGDLERYSDDPRDLSTMEYHTFVAAFSRVMLRATKKLKPNGYACVVVADFRNRQTGNYRGFVADTIHAFRELGLELYNDAVLVTAIGSLPVRIGKQFKAGRKLGKTHQNVLVFRR